MVSGQMWVRPEPTGKGTGGGSGGNWELMKKHMEGVNTNDANPMGISVTKQCLNKVAGQFSSLMEMSSKSSPSGKSATNNYRKLTLYLNSQMRGNNSRHLNSQTNTKILR